LAGNSCRGAAHKDNGGEGLIPINKKNAMTSLEGLDKEMDEKVAFGGGRGEKKALQNRT